MTLRFSPSRCRFATIIAGCIALTFSPELLHAQESVTQTRSSDSVADLDAAITDAAERSWHVEVVAGAWSPRLSGDTKLNTGLGESLISLDDQLDLHDSETTFSLELTLAVKDLSVRLSGFNFSTEGAGVFDALPPGIAAQQFGDLTISDGDAYRTDFELWTASAEARLRALNIAHQIGNGNNIAAVEITPIIGMRWLDIEHEITIEPASQSNESQWVFGQFGGAFSLHWNFPGHVALPRGITIEVAGLLGKALGADDGTLWELRAGLTINFTDNFGVAMGYRLLNFDLEDDDYTIDAGLQGLFIAGSLTF